MSALSTLDGILLGLLVLTALIAAALEHARARAVADLALAVRRKRAAEKIATKERADAYQRVVQLAGCGVAALGGISKQHLARPGQYGWSPAYQDVVDLRVEVEALRQARDHACRLIDEGSRHLAVEVLASTRGVGLAGRPENVKAAAFLEEIKAVKGDLDDVPTDPSPEAPPASEERRS